MMVITLSAMPAMAVDSELDPPPPPSFDDLLNITPEEADLQLDITKNPGEQLRRDALKEAALSLGARGGLAQRAYHIRLYLERHKDRLNKIYDFRELLIHAPSNLMIEPPIIRESLEALNVGAAGQQAAVADRIYNISRQARIVTNARNWRQYLMRTWPEVEPPPGILLPKTMNEKKAWERNLEQGWAEGMRQADEVFQRDLDRLAADFEGMVRYRVLLSQNKVSSPFATLEDRGITGGGQLMRVGDRAIRITRQSNLLPKGEKWDPADR